MKEKLTAFLFLLCILVLSAGMALNHEEGWSDGFWQRYHLDAPTGAAISSRLPALIRATEQDLNDTSFQKEGFIEFFGLTQRLLGKRVMQDAGYGAIYRTDQGQLSFGVPQQDVTPMAENTIAFSEKLRSRGIPFLYVQAPYKLAPGSDSLPKVAADFSNENADVFLSLLTRAGVDTFDLRPGFFGSGRSRQDLFFNTDHHWTIQGALLAVGLLAEQLNERYDFTIDAFYTNPENYVHSTYRDFFLGAIGRRTGRLYSGLDDFTLLTPDFRTSLSCYQRNSLHEVTRNGTFEEAVLVMEYMDESAPPDTNRYAVYPGDHEEIVFTNHSVSRGKILLIKDSFGLPFYSFLSLGVHEVRALDLRLFTGDVAEYAKRWKPDIVIVMYNADGFIDLMFNFEEKTAPENDQEM